MFNTHNTLLTLCTLGLCLSFAECYRFRPKMRETMLKAPHYSRCRFDEIPCANSTNGCISEDFLCDGKKDCPDGSDESTCYYFPCPDFAFKCTYGACISADLVCDGVQHCKDNSDESPYRCNVKPPGCIHEHCSRLQFACGTGECIENSNLCDGKADCADDSDETVALCSILRCPEFAFRCDYGACINSNRRCDAKFHCLDGSDERGCSESKPWSQPKCSRVQFECASGECITDTDLCDGAPNCRDASDETAKMCGKLHCPLFAFQCDYGACINGDLECNGRKDCHDGSDERNCTKPLTTHPHRLMDVRMDSNMAANRTLATVLPTAGENTRQSQAPQMNDGCVLPMLIPGGGWPTYDAHRISYTVAEKVVMKKFTNIKFRCPNEFALHPDNAMLYCNGNSQWDPPKLPTCLRTCPTISPKGSRANLKVRCTLNNVHVTCIRPKEGTIAIIECDQDPPVNMRRTCFDGSWDYALPECRSPPKGSYSGYPDPN